MEKKFSKLSFYVSALLFLALIAGLAMPMQTVRAAATLCVNPGGTGGCYATIQEAVDAAAAGDTINVEAGTYVVPSQINFNKTNLTLSGAGSASTIVQVSGTGERFYITAPGVTIDGFGIQKTDKAGVQNIIYIGANNVSITNNEVSGQFVIGDGDVSRAMVFTGGLSGLNISGNTIHDLRQPAYISGVTTGTISNNYVYRTKGWVLEQGDMTFTNNTWGAGADSNVYDIAILSAVGAGYYTDILAMATANNSAFIEDQRTSPAVLSIVYVDGSVAASGDGTARSPKKMIAEGITRVVTGGTVHVAAGTYTEQLTITKDLYLIGAGAGSSIIVAPTTLPASSNATSAIVLINGSGVDTELTGFTVTGPGPSACGSIRAGIYVYAGANANIHDNTIQDVRDSTFSGCQNGVAIAVGRQAWATSGTATINNNTIVGYQKGGIVVDNTGSNAIITNNMVTGTGTTSITAQNGIQISRGATATLSGNTVTGNSFHLDGSPWNWGAAGILLYQAGAVNLSGGNTVSGNDQNLYIDSATAVTVGADAFGPSTAPLYSGYEVINYTGLALDLTSATFPGESNNCQIEERIWHGVDDTVSGLVTWVAGNLYVASPESKIQNAVNKATAGDTINVCAGTYAENISIPKSATLKGAQYDVNVSGRTAADASESTIQGLVTVNSSDVNINGFTLTNPGQTYALSITPSSSNIAITYNIVDTVGAVGLAQNVHAIMFQNGADSVTISHNRFNNIKAGTKSVSAIGVLDSVSTNASTGLLIQGNIFTDIASGTRGAYGVILNNKAGVPGAQIKDNIFSGLNGGWTHAIGLEGPTPNAIVTGNIFSSLTALSPDNAAILFEKNSVGNTVTVANNQFNGVTYYGVAVHPNDLPGGSNGYSYTVIAESNWWDTASGPGIVGPGTGTLVGPNVDFTPWLCVGTDTSPAIGFQSTGQTDCSAPIVSGVGVSPFPVYLNALTTLNATADDTTTGNSNIASAEYNLNNTGWFSMTATDGMFDEPNEAITATFTASTFGSNEVCVRATDVWGSVSASTCFTFIVDYKYKFSGFFQPVDMNTVNIAKAGQSIPVKWRLTDANGVAISDPASFVGLYSYNVSCADLNSMIPDAIETYSGSSGLQYLGDGYWQFNWKTPKTYAGACRTMYVKFNDGTTSPMVDFKFK